MYLFGSDLKGMVKKAGHDDMWVMKPVIDPPQPRKPM